MDKNVGKAKSDKINSIEDNRRLPVFVKYGLIAVAIIAVIVVGILIYFSVAGSYVATVDGQKIKTGEYKYYLEMQKQTMLQSAQELDPNITADTFWATKIGGNDPTEVAKKKALDQLQETKIQYIKAKEAKITLTSDEIKGIDNSIQTNLIDSMDPNFSGTAGTGNKIRANKRFVEQYGFTIDELRSAQIENSTVQKFVKTKIPDVTDAEADIDANYSKHPDWYKEDTQFRTGAEEAVWARHILITVDESATQSEKDAAKKKAEDLIAKLKDGADFAALAKENSDDPGSKDRGGDYVFGKNQMYVEFETAAFALSPGQITETPVLTAAGYHIIKLEERYSKDQPVSLKCAKDYYEYGTSFVKYKISMERYNNYLETTVAGWAKDPKYKVNLNTAVYNSISGK